MASTPTPVLERFLESVKPIVTMERDGLVVIALDSTQHGVAMTYLTLGEALETNAVDLHELGAGAVPTVEVETHDSPVVIFGGDTIVGGKQNRIVNVTIWLTSLKKTQIPVTCLEHGRWDPGAEAHFAAGPKADLGMRRMLNTQVTEHIRVAVATEEDHRTQVHYSADQGAVWDEVALRHERAATTSRTGALHDLYAREATDVAALGRAFPCPDGATGAAIGIGGRLVALELFDHPATARKLWGRLVECAIRAHLDHHRLIASGTVPEPRHRHPDQKALGRMLGRMKLALADALLSPGVGEGTDVRFESERITGSALLRTGSVVHAEVHQVHG